MEFEGQESFREANTLTQTLLTGLIAEDLTCEEAEDEDAWLLFGAWQLPVYHFNLRLIEVPLEDLCSEQGALLRAEVGAG